MNKVFVVIPAFNEEQMIGKVVGKVRHRGYRRVIVVDDGSSDSTAKISKKNGALVLRHIINRGKGAAIKTGIEAAKMMNAQAVVTIDGDGQHNPDEIAKMIKVLKKRDVVLGRRQMSGKYMPWERIVANYLANSLTWILYGIWVSDSQCGFRAYSKKALSLIDTLSDRYEYDSEVIREIARHRLHFREIPIDTRYNVYSQRKKYRQSLGNGARMIWRLIFSP